MGPMHWIRGWGLAYGVCPWGSALVMGDLTGRHFGVGCGWFFSLGPLSGGGEGGEEETPGHVLLSRFSQDDTGFRTSFLCFIIY